jgi:hypothetical protein
MHLPINRLPMRGLPRAASAIAALCVSASAVCAEVLVPERTAAHPSVGLLETKLWGGWYRGSATVVDDSRLLFSCAHMLYDSGRWATRYRFRPGWNDRKRPGPAGAKEGRGSYTFVRYSRIADRFGGDSPFAFSSDISVIYTTGGFGIPVMSALDSGADIRSDRTKRIVGYPAYLDIDGSSGFYYQHSTPSFNLRGERFFARYHEIQGVSTGPGNSGGPVFLADPAGGDELFAGVLVAGLRRLVGVVATDSSTASLSAEALGEVRRLSRVIGARSQALPRDTFATRRFAVEGHRGKVAAAALKWRIEGGSADLFLKAPSGRVAWIVRNGTGSGETGVPGAVDLSALMAGSSANGVWELKMRSRGGRAFLQGAELQVSAP